MGWMGSGVETRNLILVWDFERDFDESEKSKWTEWAWAGAWAGASEERSWEWERRGSRKFE